MATVQYHPRVKDWPTTTVTLDTDEWGEWEWKAMELEKVLCGCGTWVSVAGAFDSGDMALVIHESDRTSTVSTRERVTPPRHP